jgi:hypothetical protein
MGVESEDAPAGGGGTEGSAGSCDVPAHVVVGGVDGFAEAALDLGAEYEGVQEIGSAD